jgi:hypothetical protein
MSVTIHFQDGSTEVTTDAAYSAATIAAQLNDKTIEYIAIGTVVTHRHSITRIVGDDGTVVTP